MGSIPASNSTFASDLPRPSVQGPPKCPANPQLSVAKFAFDADRSRVGEYTWMCRTEVDRERLVATVRGVGRARALMFVVLAAVVAGSARETGWWPFAALIGAAAGSIYLYRGLDRRRRPEYWAAAAWLVTQLPLGVGIAITGGPRSPALSWLAIAVVSLVARFNRVSIRAGMVFLCGVLIADTVKGRGFVNGISSPRPGRNMWGRPTKPFSPCQKEVRKRRAASVGC